MGKVASGTQPLGWVLGPDQRFIPVRLSSPVSMGCASCHSGAPAHDDDELILRETGLHFCVICGNPIEPRDVTVRLTQWTQPDEQKETYPLHGERRYAHFSCGIRDLQRQDLIEEHRITALQRVSTQLNPKTWIRNYKKFLRLFVEETEKVVNDYYEKEADRTRLLNQMHKAEQRGKQGK